MLTARRNLAGLLALALLSFASGCGDDDVAGGSTAACESAVSTALDTCLAEVSTLYRGCYESAGTLCDLDDAGVDAALDRSGAALQAACASDALVQAAGYGTEKSVAGLARQVAETCRAEATSLAVRSFGGPQGAARASANDAGRACLAAAHGAAVDVARQGLSLRRTCIESVAAGGTCDATAVEASIAAAGDAAVAALATHCRNLVSLVGINTRVFVDRAEEQAHCLTALAHPHAEPLALRCGPSEHPEPLPRGRYVQVELDEARWGSRCGDGSPYSFQIRLAPAGNPVENVLVGLQGGGVCIFDGDCAQIPDDLFRADDDEAPTSGIFSNDPAVSPFANWTKVFLPYCTQDVFIGGGATSSFPGVTVHRFGALNVRAALRYVRDTLWAELDRTTADGYSPERVRAFLGGFSAGAFGTIYNYHWVLDDLSWPRTTAYPDAGLALDNGQPLGVGTLGGTLLIDTPPLGWSARPFTPPYCFRNECSVGPNVLKSAAPRLLRYPEQQFMVLTNQVDITQVQTTFFNSTAAWINAMRDSYCDTTDLPGVSYFLPAEPGNIHVISPDTQLFTQRAVDGQTMRDWFAEAIANPLATQDRVEEGSLTTAWPGTQPFACEVAP